MRNRFKNYLRDGLVGLAALTSIGCATTNVVPITNQSSEYKSFERYLARGNGDIGKLLFDEIDSYNEVVWLKDDAIACADSAFAVYGRLPKDQKSNLDYARIKDLKAQVYLVSSKYDAAAGFFMGALENLNGEQRADYARKVISLYDHLLGLDLSKHDKALLERSKNYFEETYGVDKAEK